MSKEIINRIYNEVITGQTHFNVLYNSLTELRKRLTSGLTEHVAIEIFDECLLKLIRKKLPNLDFHNLLSKSIKDAKIDYYRKIDKRNKYETLIEYIDETAATVNDVEHSMIKKETDHRQVIDFLLRQSPYDSDTTAIVNEFLNDTSDDVTPGRVAAKLNLHPETVKRKLHRLARYYDTSRFGNVQEYFAV